MFRSLILRGALAVALAAPAYATASKPASAKSFQWTLSSGGDSGSGILTTGVTDSGGMDITIFSGEIDGNAIANVLGGQPGVGEATSPAGAFVYDNILYPASNSAAGALLDNGGVLFSIAGGEGNIWGNEAGPGGYSYYTYVSGNYVTENNAATFSLGPMPEFAATFTKASVPEPASLAILCVGLAALGCVRQRRLG